MDPISLLIGALVLTACAKVGIAATTDAYATRKAAQSGAWDWLSQDRERRAASRQAWAKAWAERRRRRHEAAGGDGEFRPGARQYAGDLYHGWWEDRLDRRSKKRAARPEYVYDPDRPSLAQRFDAAVLAKVQRAREVWGQRRPESVEDAPADDLFDQESLPVLEPVVHDPGTWTVGAGGERVELVPGVVPVTDVPLPRRLTAAEMRAEWQELTAVAEKALDRGDWAAAVAALDEMEARYPSVYRTSGLRSVNSDTGEARTYSLEHARAKAALELQRQLNDRSATTNDTTNGGTDMTAQTMSAAAATEVNTNEDLRQAFTTIEGLAKQALDALAVFEAVVVQMKAAVGATTDGASAKRFDSIAQQSAFDAADAVNLGDVGEWYGRFESAQAAAQAGRGSLDKYIDSETLIAENNVDTTTLAATSS